MKITDITIRLVEPLGPDLLFGDSRLAWVFVEVSTDEGITGIGECSSWAGGADVVVCRALDAMRQHVVGRDPFNAEALWHDLFHRYSFLGPKGLITTVVSGIDIALWDIRGKTLDRPVWQLLGGAVRASIPVYTHPVGSSHGAVVDSARGLVERGFRSLKFDPFMHGAEPFGSFRSGVLSPVGIRGAEALMGELRDVVGVDGELMVDMHGRFNPSSAVAAIRAIEPHGMTWFEEPVPPEGTSALRLVRDRTTAPLCVGERIYTRWDAMPVLEQRLVDYLMPDVCWTGGITELRKIATLAEAFGIPISPHGALGPVQAIAGAHAMLATPNFFRLELATAWLAEMNRCLTEPLDLRGDELHLAKRPGLGVELDVDFVSAHESQAWLAMSAT